MASNGRLPSTVTGGSLMRGLTTVFALLVATVALAALPGAASAAGSEGSLSQKLGLDACVSETGTGGDCTDGVGLDHASSVSISPDGKNAYVASNISDAVAIFDRDILTGALTQKGGSGACISETGTGGSCTIGFSLGGASSVTISPDGENVYVASNSSNSVAIFDRNIGTGALTQKTGTDACVSETGTDGACADGTGLVGADSTTVSPDGANVYVASQFSDAVSVLDRNTETGVLTQKGGTAGCISDDGTGGACADGIGFDGARSVAVSPDGSSAYVASDNDDTVVVLDRNPVTGALTQKGGTAGCISEDGTGGACTDGKALTSAASVTVSPDNRSVYAVSVSSGAVVVFDRSTATGTLTQKPGFAGCVSAIAFGCVGGVGLEYPRSVATSPDGKSVYVASRNSGSVAVLDRNPSNGVLTQKSGAEACISEDGTGGACTDGVGLAYAKSVTVSPDGRNAYVTSDVSLSTGTGAIAVFDREDSTPPDEVTLEAAIPASPANENSPSIGGMAETGSSVRIYTTSDCTGPPAVTGPAAEFEASGLAVTVADDSTNTLHATATDGSGNASACSTSSVTYVEDSTPPDTTIDSGPTGTITTDQATFTFSGDPAADTAKIQCQIDGESFADCTSPTTFAGLAEGFHTATFRAEDAAGNQDPTPATGTFTVDTTVYRAKIGKVSVKGPAKVKKGKKATYRVKISNSGNADATGVRLKVSGKGLNFNTSIGKIAAGKTRTVKVKVKPTKPGKVKASFKVTSKNAGGKTVKKTVTVKR